MSEDLTKTVVVKRRGKSNSCYIVEEGDGGDYFLAAVPEEKAKLNEGDQIVSINGIAAHDFVDAGDANALIESIRIKVVPNDDIEAFDADTRRAGVKPNAAHSSGADLKCMQCGYFNENIEPDEDGDYVCEECGYTIPEQAPNALDAYSCPDCSHVTYGPEPDEEGDRICEECGCILPEKVNDEMPRFRSCASEIHLPDHAPWHLLRSVNFDMH